MAPTVSVIIPTYDRWPMVREAVDSVLAQSYSDFELVVVDDGSRDGTGQMLALHAPGLRLVRQVRAGVAAARNSGVRNAAGKYLAFLDSDDLWTPLKLEKQVGFMEANPAARICQTEEIWLRRGVRVNPRARHRKPSGDIFRRSLALCLVSPSAVMMTRDLYDRFGGFDEAFTVCEDYDLWLRIALVTEVPLIPEPLVIKRGGHPDQLSRSIWGLDRFRVLALAKLLAAGIEGEQRLWVADVLRQKAAILAHGARRRGRFAEALDCDRLVKAYTANFHACGDRYREAALRGFRSRIESSLSLRA